MAKTYRVNPNFAPTHTLNRRTGTTDRQGKRNATMRLNKLRDLESRIINNRNT